jgi:putative ABC transport system permease protein
MCNLYVAAVSRLVPEGRRREWLAEWTGELWQLLQQPHRNSKGRRLSPFGFLMGALKHALWEWRSYRRATNPAVGAASKSHSRSRLRSALMTTVQDIRFAVRQVLKRPTFALVVCSTLALGIGANTALFSVLYGVLLRPLPYPDAEEVTTIWWQNIDLGWTHNALTAPDLLDIQADNETFEAVGIFRATSTTMLRSSDPQRIMAHAVTPEVFEVTEVSPLLGRVFLPEDDVPGAPNVAVISHGLWQQGFGADSDVIGKTVTLSWGDFTVIGVMPQEFRWTVWGEPRLWVPLRLNETQKSDRRNHFLLGVGRLRDGTTLAQARTDLNAIAGRLEQEYPESNSETGVTVETISNSTVGDIRFTLWLIMCAAGVLLLIACANVASLFLSQCLSRRREMAVRASLGAGRVRQIRRLLTESLLLSRVGGFLGVLLAHVGVQLFLIFEPGEVPRTDGVAISSPVLLFCFGTSILTSVVFGVAPAMLATGADLVTSLKAAARSSSLGHSSMRVKNALAVVQMATAVVLLVGAGLLGRSFSRMTQVDPGFDIDNILMAEIPQGGDRYRNGIDRVRFQEELLTRLDREPNIQIAAAVTSRPFSVAPQIRLIHQGSESDLEQQVVSRLYVSPDYFDVLGMTLLSGRLLNEQDREGAPRVVVISDAAARRHWSGQNPVGQSFHLGRPDSPLLEIVGVVSDIRQYGVRYRPYPAAFVPYAQAPAGDYHLMLKTERDPLSTTVALRAIVRDMDPGMAIGGIQTLEGRVAANVASPRFLMLLSCTFAVIAVALAATGIYGVLAYAVSQRSHEIGIRLALGASRERVLRAVLFQGIGLAGVAVLFGLPLAYALSRTMRRMLFEIGTADPITFGTIVVVVLAVSIAACYFPAARAAGSDPLKALRID